MTQYKPLEAAELYFSARVANTAGEHSQAEQMLTDALHLLGETTPDTDTPPRHETTLRARITRDLGFTVVRFCAANKDATRLPDAQETLHTSLELTAPYVSGITLPGEGILPKRLRRRVFAEHAATLGLLARAGTVAAVLGSEDDDAQQYYGHAHDIGLIGSNPYYGVSNALAAARQEVINGSKPPHVAVWLGRAAHMAAVRLPQDPGNTRAVLQIVGSGIPHLRSRRAAVASVLTHP